jgi:hypothetical protein
VPFRSLGRVAVFAALVLHVSAVSVDACSPPFEEPTIRALGPQQLVVVGRIGAKVPGGRLFHVERWFNGGRPTTPLIIAFKEGDPIGDCSYLVAEGAHLIIAPRMTPDGLAADLSTLQADPATDVGRRYLAEAIVLFGYGVVPTAIPAERPAGELPDLIPITAAVLVAVLGLFGVVLALSWRRRSGARP